MTVEPFVIGTKVARWYAMHLQTKGIIHNDLGCRTIKGKGEALPLVEAIGRFPDITYRVCKYCYKSKIGRNKSPRVPAGPFLEYLGAVTADNAFTQAGTARPVQAMADRLGCSAQTVQRIKREDTITLHKAENYCDALDLHVTEIWPDWYELVRQATSETDVLDDEWCIE